MANSLNTRLVIRNDGTANWELVKDSVKLLKGELGIEFGADGKAKIKVGDGVSTWGQLDYYGGNDEEILERIATIEEDYLKATDKQELIESIEKNTSAITALQTAVNNVYTKTETDAAIASAIGSAGHLKRVIVENESLPTENIDPDTIYMVKFSAEGDDRYQEWMYINDSWEIIGDTRVDLSDYVTSDTLNDYYTITEVNTILENYYTESEIVNILKDYSTAEEISKIYVTQESIEQDLSAYAKSSAVNEALAKKVDAVEGSRLITTDEADKLDSIQSGAQVNIINSVDETYFSIDDAKKLTLLDIAMGKVTGLEEALAGKADDSEITALNDKIGTVPVYGENGVLVTAGTGIYQNVYTKDEVTDLIADITGGESAADVLAALNAYKTTNDSKVQAVEDKLATVENGAQINVLEAINFNGQDIIITDKKATFSYEYILPIATADILGGVKSSAAENKVAIAADGTMEVNSVNVNKLVQTEGETLILNGGSASSN